MKKSIQREAAETFFVLQWRGQSGKRAAKEIGYSQATLNRWARDFKGSRLIKSVSRVQSLRSKIYWAVHKEKINVPEIVKMLVKIEELNRRVYRVISQAN